MSMQLPLSFTAGLPLSCFHAFDSTSPLMSTHALSLRRAGKPSTSVRRADNERPIPGSFSLAKGGGCGDRRASSRVSPE